MSDEIIITDQNKYLFNETLVAKLRNKLSPAYGLAEIVLLIDKNPDIKDIMIAQAKQAIENKKAIRELLVQLESELAEDFAELKTKVQLAYTEIWQTQLYPLSTIGKPKADDILKKYFPFLKP